MSSLIKGLVIGGLGILAGMALKGNENKQQPNLWKGQPNQGDIPTNIPSQQSPFRDPPRDYAPFRDPSNVYTEFGKPIETTFGKMEYKKPVIADSLDDLKKIINGVPYSDKILISPSQIKNLLCNDFVKEAIKSIIKRCGGDPESFRPNEYYAVANCWSDVDNKSCNCGCGGKHKCDLPRNSENDVQQQTMEEERLKTKPTEQNQDPSEGERIGSGTTEFRKHSSITISDPEPNPDK